MIKHEPILELETLGLNKAAKGFLKEISKWTKFLAILGFIGIGLLVVFALFYSKLMNSIGTSEIAMAMGNYWTISVLYIVLAILFFFPNYYLLQFSNKLKEGLKTKNDDILAKSLEMLKSHYKFYGVFTIIMLSIYLIVFVFSFFGLII